MNTNSWVFSSWKGSTRWYMQGDRYRREIRPPLSSHKHSFLPGTKYTAIVGTTKVHHVSRIVLSRTRNGQLFFSWIDLCTRTYSTSKVGPKKSLRHFGRDYPNTYSFVVTYRKKKKERFVTLGPNRGISSRECCKTHLRPRNNPLLTHHETSKWKLRCSFNASWRFR